MGQGACVADSDGHVVWSNLRFRNFDDATRGKIAAKCREAIAAFAEKPPGQERTKRFEIPVPEEQRSLELTVSPVALGGPESTTTSVAAIVRDVTSDKRLRQKFDAVDRAGGQIVSFET